MSAYEKAEKHIVMRKEREAPTGLDNVNNQGDFIAEGLTGTCKTVLNNPVLPLEFGLIDPTSAVQHEWEFENGNRVPFAKVSRGFKSISAGGQQ